MKKALADALEHKGYASLTPVQEAVNKPELANKDLLVSAQTGSGKTVGFGIAIAPAILEDEDVFHRATLPLALVIAPTRELALQVKRELTWLYAEAKATVVSCVGGMDMRDERRALERGAHIVVATPGRLRDHITRGSINLTDIRAVVLDEADEMLDLGFREDLEFILEECPKERQTLMFSATVPKAIAKLAESYQRDALRISTTAERSQHTDISYYGMTVAPQDSENAIINVLRFYESPNAIVFANTRGMVNRLTTRLSNRGFSVVALSGELSQNDRTHALQAMRDGRARVCVATDVAARGIDLPNLDLVVHAELPSNHETLLHRSGRTGRAGRKGTCALIVPPRSRKKAERILKLAKVKAQWENAPSADAVKSKDEERLLSDPTWLEPIAENQQDFANKLTSTFTAEQLAAAYLRLYQSKHSAPEELSAVDDKPKPRAEFGPSVWFSLSEGRANNADPRRILPMLCNAGGISKADIGAIRIRQEETYFEISQNKVAGFVKAIGPKLIVENGATLKQMREAPAFLKAGKSSRGDSRPPHRGSRDRNRDDSHGEKRGEKRGERRDKSDRRPTRDSKPDFAEKRRPRSERKTTFDPLTSATPKAVVDEHGDHKGNKKGKGKNPSLQTPVGKTNSKKNKARAAAKAAVAKANKA